ncbi:MAG: hypothetical protein P1V20_22225 [Verrucomicrobiales bacterium]|nr:hypothetical protein [Verrucomicrobiales bacterium]
MFPVYTAQPADKSFTNYRFRDWVDRELVQHSRCGKLVSDEDLDNLLELRDLICQHTEMDPANVIRTWFRLRKRLQRNFYLLCYRLRNWIAVHYELNLSDPLERTGPLTTPLDLSHKNFHSLLTAARQSYFEHSEVLVPWNDIRISVVAKS